MTMTRNDARSRYEGRVGAALATVIDFDWQDPTMTITHTGTEPEWRGRGLAGEATAYALADIRRLGRRVRPACPFTVEFMRTHPEFDDLAARPLA